MPTARPMVAGLLVAMIVGAGCRGTGDSGAGATRSDARRQSEPAPESDAPEPTTSAGALLPAAAGPFAPARVEVEGELSGERFVDDDVACEGCHADVVRQWRSSSHAGASLEDPTYLATFDRFRAAAGEVASRFCAGCHMPGLLIDGAVDVPVSPDDVRAHSGITCTACHRISGVETHGNGSYRLAGGVVPDPDPKVRGSLDEHVAGFAMEPLRTVELCGACHRGFLHPELGVDHFLPGGDVITPHLASGYAGNRLSRVDDPVEEQDCIACHMPPEEAVDGDLAASGGMVASHRFVGANTWMAAMRGDDRQLALLTEKLEGAASIDVSAATLADGTWVMPADGAPVIPGQRMVLDVVVRNLKVGHLFPGAALDVQDTWIEVAVTDSNGDALAEAGANQARTGRDPTAHTFTALMVDRDGTRLRRREFHRFDTAVINAAIGPRDAAVVRYSLTVPADLADEALPLTVTARLRHRRNGLELQELACEVARTGRGRAFARATRRMGREPLDPCSPQPIVDVAVTRVQIGAGAVPPADPAPSWRRAFELGLAFTHQLQEHLDQARQSFDRSLELLGDDGTPRERAMVQAALARVAAHQGRTAEALSLIDDAEVGVPGHPALLALRGEALARVWRWQQAVEPLRAAAASAPRDVRAWTRLAVALGSSLSDARALEAAQRGLALWPVKPELLRAQALALGRLGHADAPAAMDSYLVHRGHDDPSDVRLRCAQKDPTCARERLPVHVHELRPAR